MAIPPEGEPICQQEIKKGRIGCPIRPKEEILLLLPVGTCCGGLLDAGFAVSASAHANHSDGQNDHGDIFHLFVCLLSIEILKGV
jgi:hypothetical protein